MPKSFRSIRCLFLVLSGVSLAACNSSGNGVSDESANGIEDRPTIVSADAITVDNPDFESSDVVSDTDGPAIAENVGTQDSTDAPAADSSDEPNETTGSDGVSDEINTIEGSLAHLEAERADSDMDSADQVSETDETAAPDSTDPGDENQPTGDLPTDDTIQTEDAEGSEPSSADGLPETLSDAPVEPVVDLVEDAAVSDPPVVSPTQSSANDTPSDADIGTDSVLEESEDPQHDNDATDAEASDISPPDTGFSPDLHDIVLDCLHELPCEASNDDSAVSVVVENVYRHPETRRLAIAMSVTANRDTALRWDNDITSTDGVGNNYNGTSREFSGFFQLDRDNDMVTLLAGTTLVVVQHFREMPSESTVSIVRFDTGYIEAGVRTSLQFSNMPLDPVLGDIVDCADQVPCSWLSNDQSFSVNVLKASGLWQTGRLRIDFEVRPTVGMGINLFSSDPVVGNDGSLFTPRTHSLGSTSDFQEVTVQLVAEGVQVGHQDFLKNADRLATSLVQVKLGMTRVDVPGAGSPVFRNLPLE